MRGLIKVRGNSDAYTDGYLSKLTHELSNGQKVFMAHGHKHDRYDVESNYYLLQDAQKVGAKFAFYGHTHFADVVQVDGVVIVNPGSTYEPRASWSGHQKGIPSYAVLTITNQDCNVQILAVADNSVIIDENFVF